MDKQKSTAVLEDFKPFHHLSETSKVLLGRGLRYTLYKKTTAVLRKGQKISGAYVVVSGQLRVYTLTPDGKEATLYWISPGETCVLALNCIFNDLLYPAWVEARPDTKIAMIAGDLYRALFESEPAIRNMTVQAFSSIVFRLMAELEQVHSHKLEHRLANFLLLHASADGAVRMTQQEIGSHLGATREVIARLLRRFVSEKCIETKRNILVITSPAMLAKRVNRLELPSEFRKDPSTKRAGSRSRLRR